VVELQDCAPRDGNVSLTELLVIAGLVRQRRPRTLLEIGTFDGNTTLQMARNAPADARVFTLDLPPGNAAPAGTLATHDHAYIGDQAKARRKFEGTAVANRVVQWLGDSMTFDFAGALGGREVDFAFVDGSHSYAYVASDTSRVLARLAPAGLVLWHDYAPVWPGVMQFLDELAATEPLRRIEGTSLVVLDRRPAA
jgi:predicted O-methyltransferase YrrM